MTHFVDHATVELIAGNGGPGAISFRREKYVPFGGPSGGDGGKGGDILFVACDAMHTLSDFRNRRSQRAQHGQPGGTNQKSGHGGDDLIIQVPSGTMILDDETGDLIADLTEPNQPIVVARGGDGGKGNARYKSSTNRAPKYATPGFPGQHLIVRLELKLIADVALVGYPSVGKSTLISVLSNARPKIADYPFTTLVPNLGVVPWHDFKSFVIADVPGLIEGAHQGHGLGIQFLRHIERTHVICHLIEVRSPMEEEQTDRDPLTDYHRIRRELELFNPELSNRPEIVVLNKMELPWVAEREASLRATFTEMGIPFFAISALNRMGLDPLTEHLGQTLVGLHAL